MISDLEGNVKLPQKHTHWIVTTGEEERKKLSYELQDKVNHLLFTAKLYLYLIENKIVKNINTSRLRKILEEAIKEIVNISTSLYPIILDEMGLAGAISNLLKEYKKKSNININFENLNIPKQIPFFIKTNIFRIVQEFIILFEKQNNISKISLSFSKDESIIILLIYYIGEKNHLKKIFQNKNEKSNSALFSIKERIELLNCELKIESKKVGESEIILNIPLEKNAGGSL
jgi:signal transduction histidine kinase